MAERLLLLGGTRDAVDLASALAGDPRVEPIYSLAGRTRSPTAVPCPVRVGGFGGADGLAAWLAESRIDVLVDATHPYAVAISEHAAIACDRLGVARVALHRPAWAPGEGDRWIEVGDAAAAARALPALGARALLAIGTGSLSAFVDVPGVRFVVRSVEPPAIGLPADRFEVVLARGPFAVDDERALLERYGVDVVVAKNSGGEAARAKLLAARERAIPVVMIRRPEAPPGERVDSPGAVLEWIERRLAARGGNRHSPSASR